MQASGTLQNLSTGAARTFKADAHGAFVFSGLPFGAYRLEASARGFVAGSLHIDIQSETPVVRSLILALAQAPQSKVEVIASMPLPGVELSPEQIASPVQTASQREIAQSGALNLTDYLRQRVNGVRLNEVQGNT